MSKYMYADIICDDIQIFKCAREQIETDKYMFTDKNKNRFWFICRVYIMHTTNLVHCHDTAQSRYFENGKITTLSCLPCYL